MSHTNGFSKNADLYRTSRAHSDLEDLEQSLEHLPAVTGLEVLDVATGTGHTAFFFARKQAHVFGVDINEEMLRVAQEESDSKSLSVRFLKCPVEDLMFDDEIKRIFTEVDRKPKALKSEGPKALNAMSKSKRQLDRELAEEG